MRYCLVSSLSLPFFLSVPVLWDLSFSFVLLFVLSSFHLTTSFCLLHDVLSNKSFASNHHHVVHTLDRCHCCCSPSWFSANHCSFGTSMDLFKEHDPFVFQSNARSLRDPVTTQRIENLQGGNGSPRRSLFILRALLWLLDLMSVV
ncbi:hypothetical protein B0O80DRAFT_447696 [Mortierella sp. GBAus27b]|nr:hypothetical protein B0O80DRAFT_447696 [Mortierella sp. GBAus27b]